ncbi:FkbM family methyltransferase [Alsobacter sp. R-9]
MPPNDDQDPVAVPRQVDLRGRRFAVTDDKPTFWDRAEDGRWEPETLAALGTLAGPGTSVLDIGAWVGPTVLFAAASGAERVVAVEADPRALELLRGNLAANPRLAGRVDVVAAAAAARPGSVRLGSARKRGDSMSSALLAGGEDWWEVPAVTPAQLLDRVGPASRLVVKVDIEGGEYDLLPALAAALPACCAALLVAFHPVLMRRGGATDEDVARRTDAVFDALAGFAPALLETGPAGGRSPREAARADNVTVLFERASY